MDVLAAIRGRRSIRTYRPIAVEEEKLLRVLEAARLAPSASNRQDWRFIVVRDRRTREALAAAAYDQQFVGRAPVVIVACATNPVSVMLCGQPTHTVDLSIAVAFMVLEAHELGLGTCWLGAFDEDMVKGVLSIPDGVRVVTMIPLGYPDEQPAARPRKDLAQIVCFEEFGPS